MLLNDECDGTFSETQHQKLIEKEVFSQSLNLENSKRSMIEMESVSINIMGNLKRNNENLLNINNKVEDLSKEIDNGNTIMRRIFRKENKNKIVIAVFTMIFLLMFVLIVNSRIQTAN